MPKSGQHHLIIPLCTLKRWLPLLQLWVCLQSDVRGWISSTTERAYSNLLSIMALTYRITTSAMGQIHCKPLTRDWHNIQWVMQRKREPRPLGGTVHFLLSYKRGGNHNSDTAPHVQPIKHKHQTSSTQSTSTQARVPRVITKAVFVYSHSLAANPPAKTIYSLMTNLYYFLA